MGFLFSSNDTLIAERACAEVEMSIDYRAFGKVLSAFAFIHVVVSYFKEVCTFGFTRGSWWSG